MIMTLEEVNDHVDSIRADLVIKKIQLPGLFLTDPVTGMAVRYQIECLEPRLDELERHARRLAKEREAALSVPVP